jgi:hypothetical protein
MANLSTAYGHLKFRKDDWDGISATFKEFVKNYGPPCYYGVHFWIVDENYADSVRIEFYGTGRWTFDDCVKDVDWFFYTDENPLGKEIIAYIASLGKGSVRIQFFDYEEGCEVLYQANGYSVTDSEGNLHFRCLYDNYEITAANLWKLGFIENFFDDEADLVAAIKKYMDSELSEEQLKYVHQQFEYYGGGYSADDRELDLLSWELEEL